MDASKVGNYLQIIANFGIVAGLVLVGIQINQNTQIAAADMTSRSYEIAAQYHLALLGENPIQAVARAANDPDALTDEDLLILERIVAFWVDFDSRGEINVANNLTHRELADKYLRIHAKTLYGPNSVTAAIWHDVKEDLGGESYWIDVVDSELSTFEQDTNRKFLSNIRSVIQAQRGHEE